MIYRVEDLKKDIRVALDENAKSERLLASGDEDTLRLDEVIESKIVDAARLVESNAPVYFLDGGKPFGESIGWKGQPGYGAGYVLLPDDFLRLVSFQMSDWSVQVSTAITEDDPLYLQQQSRYPGIRGCPQKPVVAITNQPVGKYLEFYSCSGGEGVYVKRAQYIPLPHVKDDMIIIPEKLRSAVVAYAAGLVAQSIREEDLAKNMFELAKQLIQ